LSETLRCNPVLPEPARSEARLGRRGLKTASRRLFTWSRRHVRPKIRALPAVGGIGESHASNPQAIAIESQCSKEQVLYLGRYPSSNRPKTVVLGEGIG